MGTHQWNFLKLVIYPCKLGVSCQSIWVEHILVTKAALGTCVLVLLLRCCKLWPMVDPGAEKGKGLVMV
jgi:hypothetical protein